MDKGGINGVRCLRPEELNWGNRRTAVSALGASVQWALGAVAGAPGGTAGDIAFLLRALLPFPGLRKEGGRLYAPGHVQFMVHDIFADTFHMSLSGVKPEYPNPHSDKLRFPSLSLEFKASGWQLSLYNQQSACPKEAQGDVCWAEALASNPSFDSHRLCDPRESP